MIIHKNTYKQILTYIEILISSFFNKVSFTLLVPVINSISLLRLGNMTLIGSDVVLVADHPAAGGARHMEVKACTFAAEGALGIVISGSELREEVAALHEQCGLALCTRADRGEAVPADVDFAACGDHDLSVDHRVLQALVECWDEALPFAPVRDGVVENVGLQLERPRWQQ